MIFYAGVGNEVIFVFLRDFFFRPLTFSQVLYTVFFFKEKKLYKPLLF